MKDSPTVFIGRCPLSEGLPFSALPCLKYAGKRIRNSCNLASCSKSVLMTVPLSVSSVSSYGRLIPYPNNALLVLKTQGFVREAGRGLSVAPLDPKLFEVIYVISTYPPLHLREAINRCRMDIERSRDIGGRFAF
jgi:hypothetical protein